MRLTAELWVSAYLRRLDLEAIPAVVETRGDPVAGAVIVKLDRLDGQVCAFHRIADFEVGRRWDMLTEGSEAEVTEIVARQRAFDPDLWVIAVEDRFGRHMLDLPEFT